MSMKTKLTYSLIIGVLGGFGNFVVSDYMSQLTLKLPIGFVVRMP